MVSRHRVFIHQWLHSYHCLVAWPHTPSRTCFQLETLRKPLEKSDEVEFWHIWLCNLKIMDHTSYNLFLTSGFIFLLFLRQIFLLSLLQFIILLKTENLLYCSNLYWKKIINQLLKFKICNQKLLQLAQ